MLSGRVGVAALLALFAWTGAGTAQDPARIEVWLVSTADRALTRAGARMASAEMAQTAGLLGKRFALREVEVSRLEEAEASLLSAPRTAHPTFVVVDLEWRAACRLAEAAGPRRFIWLATQVANEPCGAPLLQLRLPQPARDKVLAAHATTQNGGSLRVDEWHPALTRFGAGELNERFERYARDHIPALPKRDATDPPGMDGDGWAGWFAVKVAAESTLRGIATQEQLTGEHGPPYDGHKGVALRFGAAGVLQQPVFIIDDEAGSDRRAVVAEIP